MGGSVASPLPFLNHVRP